jgi:lipopolysaccharide transport protein LptA
VTASTYIGITAVGLVALSGWLVKVDGDAYSGSAKNIELQKFARYPNRVAAPAPPPNPAAKLDHARYGWVSQEGESSLATSRPMGARVEPRLPQIVPTAASFESRSLQDLSEIPGPLDQGLAAEPVFEPVSSASGYHINADEADKIGNGSERIIFKGHVTLTSPTFNLSSDKLVMHMGKDGETFKLAEASGSVKVQLVGVPLEKRYRGQSETALYDPKKGTLVMVGWPKIQGDGQELVAAASDTKVTLYPATGKLSTEGRAQTRVARHFMEAEPKK